MSATTNRFFFRLILVLAVLAAAGWWGFLELRPVAVIEPVTSGLAIDAKPGNVTVEEDFAMELKSELGGRVLKQNFALAPGDEVKADQVLVQLDPADMDLKIEKDQSALDSTTELYAADHSKDLALESALVGLENLRRQNALGAYPKADLEAAERLYKSQQEGVELEKINRRQALAELRNTLKVERLQRSRLTIRAPADMIVKAVNVHPGDLIADKDVIATLITEHKTVVGKISDEDFAKVRVDQPARVIFVPYHDEVFDGKVAKILPTADPLTQRHIVYLDVQILAERLVPGINGEVSIVVDQHQAQAIVPRRAVFSVNGDNVYVVRGGRVELRKVTKGFVWSKGVEITKGLAPGEKVIVERLEDFHDDQAVSVREYPSDAVGSKQ